MEPVERAVKALREIAHIAGTDFISQVQKDIAVNALKEITNDMEDPVYKPNNQRPGDIVNL